MNHFERPRHAGVLPHANGVGEARNPACGDQTRIYVRQRGDRLCEVSFQACGCGPGIACASYLLEQVNGRPVSDALAITARRIAGALELPSSKLHAAELAVRALHAAVASSRCDQPADPEGSRDLAV